MVVVIAATAITRVAHATGPTIKWMRWIDALLGQLILAPPALTNSLPSGSFVMPFQ